MALIYLLTRIHSEGFDGLGVRGVGGVGIVRIVDDELAEEDDEDELQHDQDGDVENPPPVDPTEAVLDVGHLQRTLTGIRTSIQPSFPS